MNLNLTSNKMKGSKIINRKKKLAELQAENEKLKAELKNEKYSRERIREVKDVFKAENERIKAALKDKSQVYAEIEADHIGCINTCTQTIRKLRKENAKLKCLTLHLFSKYFFDCYWNSKGPDSIRYLHLCQKYGEAYRKAKQELREGK